MFTTEYKKCLPVILVFLTLVACSQEKEQEKKETAPLSYSYETIARSHPNCNDQTAGNGCVELSYSYPVFTGGGDLPVKDSLRKAIGEFIFVDSSLTLSEASFDTLAKEWFAVYDSTRNEIKDYDIPWEQRIRVNLIRQTPSYLSVEFTDYEFLGGAHDNEIKMYRMFRIPAGDTLSLSELLTEGKKDQLAVMAENSFRELKKFPDDVDYDARDYHFRDGIFTLNRNFALTDSGLLFHYNPYEIAPYSEGPTRLLMPYSQIDSLLAEPFRSSSFVNNE